MKKLLLVAFAAIFASTIAFSDGDEAAEALKKAGYSYVDLKKDTYKRFVVTAELDGKEFKLIIDHQWDETILDKNALDRHGIEADETGKEWSVNGDEDDLYVTTIKETKVGEGVIGEQDILAVDFEEFDFLDNIRADGMLGSDFLVKYSAMIDLTNQRLYIKTK